MPFDLYDNRRILGNVGHPDGYCFCGRGFVQLTGRANYKRFGQHIGVGDGLLTNPFSAHHADLAARILAAFLKEHETGIRAALHEGKLDVARRLVNGGTYGLPQFSATYQAALTLFNSLD